MKTIQKYLEKIQDKRRKQGKRYKLSSIILLVLLGYMSGCTSLAKIYRLGQSLNKKTRYKLGFNTRTPSHPTITKTMRMIEPTEFEVLLSSLINHTTGKKFIQVAIDGKSIRSTSNNKGGLLHLVSAFAPEVNAVLLQSRSEVAGGEIKTAAIMVSKIPLKGKVVTADALYAQEVLCNKIVSAKGDYVLKVKRNKKKIIADIEEGLNLAYAGQIPVNNYEYTEKGHGRIDVRRIEVIASHRKYFGGWAMNTIRQAAKITKTSFNLKTGKEGTETQYIISSLLPYRL